ncbi:MAG: extracellular solute-binding protein, partial [Rubrobacter sp.]|nr:extracellular solute-binding protein [Rubrobacter sp.]
MGNRRITRRQFIQRSGAAALGASFAGTLLAGCGGGSEGGSGQVAYWSNLEGSGPQDYFGKNIETPFEKSNKGTQLKVTFQPPDEMDRLLRTALQGGEGPDIVMTPGPAYAQEYIDANLFAELDDYAGQYGWDDKLLGWALDLGRVGGSLSAIPYQLQTMLLYHNKSLFGEMGMKPPKNRDELEAMAEELSGQGITPFAAGIGDDPAAVEWFPTVFWNHYSGPDALYQALTGETKFADPIFVEAIELFKSYVDNGWFGGSQERFFSNGFDTLHADFGDGKAAMNVEGSWFMASAVDFFGQAAGNENDWDWTPLPPLREGVPPELYELGIGSTLSVNQSAQNPEGAAAFVDYLVADKARVTEWMAAVPSAFNAPLPFQEGDFPSSMDPRVERQLVSLSQATSEGNFGYTNWSFFPAKSTVYIQEEMQ